MGERQGRALGRGGSEDRGILRPHHSLALHAVAAPGILLAGGLALPSDPPLRRLAALAFLAAAAALVAGPLVGTGPRRGARTASAALGVILGLLPAALIFGAPAADALTAGAALAGFLVLLSGLSAVAGAGAGGLAGAVLVASFHLGDPLLEWHGPNSYSPLGMWALHAANPLSGAVGSALGLDWLRLPILYRGFPGGGGVGLTAAPFYSFWYFPWWGTVVLHGGLGAALLLAAGRRFVFPRSGAGPKIRAVGGFEIDGTLSVIGEACPMNYVRTKLRLEGMEEGRILEIYVSDGEAARNVPRSASEEGHEVVSVEPAGDGRVRVLVRKREARRGS